VNTVNVKFFLLFDMIQTRYFKKLCSAFLKHTLLSSISLSQSKWSWRRSHLKNLHVRVDRDCKKSKYRVVPSYNGVTIIPSLVKIRLLVQTLKYENVNSALRSEKKNPVLRNKSLINSRFVLRWKCTYWKILTKISKFVRALPILCCRNTTPHSVTL